MKKKIIITVISLILVVCLTLGGIYIYREKSLNSNPVDVQPVSNMLGGWYEDDSSSYGMISTGMVQEVFYNEQLIIKEILVAEGDKVEIGTPLISYDTTLIELQLEMKKMELEGINLNIQEAERTLDKLKKTKPVASSSQSEGRIIPLTAGEPESEDMTKPEALSEITVNSKPYEGKGTKDEPYRFLCKVGVSVSPEFITHAAKEKLVYVFEILDGTDDSDTVIFSWTLDGSSLAQLAQDSIEPTEPEPTEPEPTEPEPTEPDIDEPSFDEPGFDEPGFDEPGFLPGPSGPTKEELEKSIREQESKIKELNLDKRTAEIEYKQLENSLAEGTLNSTVNGTVGAVLDEETARLEQKPMMTVTGEEGYYVNSTIPETHLDNISVGQSITVMSYYSGMVYEASVTSISDVPSDNNYYYGSGNSNVSYYPFTAVINSGDGLSENEDVQITFSSDTSSSENSMYISNAYVREEDGISYVFIEDENGRLKKQPVKTGKLIYGSEIEILAGLLPTDYIAFPYGKNVKEGAKVNRTEGNMYY